MNELIGQLDLEPHGMFDGREDQQVHRSSHHAEQQALMMTTSPPAPVLMPWRAAHVLRGAVQPLDAADDLAAQLLERPGELARVLAPERRRPPAVLSSLADPRGVGDDRPEGRR